MKKAFKISGFIGLGFVALLLCLAAYIQFAPMPVYKVKAPKLTIAPDSTRIAEGRRIALTVCAYCHRGPDGKLSGRLWADDPMLGKLWSANLTQHPTAGIAGYSDAELAFTLRTGIKRDGHFAGPFMQFPLLSDADLVSVIAFLRSTAPEVQPSERRQPIADVRFLGKMWYKLLVSPFSYPKQAVVVPPVADKLAYGRYLVTGKWQCYQCHSAGFETNDPFEPEKSKGYFGGGNPIAEPGVESVFSANITPDRNTGIGNWTEAQFADAIRFGKRPDGKVLSPLMPPFSAMTDTEVSAIWAYLQTVPPITNPTAVKAGAH